MFELYLLSIQKKDYYRSHFGDHLFIEIKKPH